MGKIETRNKILFSILFIICLFLLKNNSEVNAATYIWPVGGENYGETYIEYEYKPRFYDSDAYNQKYNYGTPEQYYKNTIQENHFGVDIVGIKGNTYDIVSVVNGTVIATSADRTYNPGLNFVDRNLRRSSAGMIDGGGYGNYVVIKDSVSDKCFLYGHLKAGTVTVKKGDTVTEGQKFAIMGSSGDSGHMHVHFEVRRDINNVIVNGGAFLVNTTGYNIQTENPIDYIGNAPVVPEPEPEPEPVPEPEETEPAKREKITFIRYTYFRQINIYYDKPIIVEKEPTITVKVGDKTTKAYYYNISGDNKMLIYRINYKDFDLFTSGDMKIECSNDGIIKNQENEKLLVECKFKDVKIGTLQKYKINNTYENIINTGVGDVNQDGYIDAVDSSIVLSIYSKLSTGITLDSVENEQKQRGDVNQDGYIDSIDSSIILSYYASMSTGLTKARARNIIKCDANKDGEVDVNDYELLESAINSGNYEEKYDLNKDNVLDSKDIEYFRNVMLGSGRRIG